VDVLFYLSVGFILYTYAGYPLIMLLWSTLLPRRVEKRYQTEPLSVVLAVKNEEINIRIRLENLLAQDYPPELIEIIVVSNGSTDHTVELARQFEDDRVKVIEFVKEVGKSGALNAGVENASHDIVVFADARQRFGDNVFAELVAMFADEKVGAVSGELIIEPGVGSEVQEGVGLYWRYEKSIRRMESEVRSVVGATGSIYAIRKRLYLPLALHTLLDDLLIPMRIVLQGYRVIFIRSARAFDITSSTATQEFARKVRTLAGNFQAVAMEKRLLNPLRNKVFFQFVSHKMFRLLVPYFCLAVLFSSALSQTAFLQVLFAAQIVFYTLGFLNKTRLGKSKLGALTRVPWTFMVMNAAAVVGMWVYVTGRDRTVWKKP
jgi:cellulose synthase/poly-beta-1,6-N-acetylglucosamine synthase-like glycosyltransferase